jgi:hypothetical protein
MVFHLFLSLGNRLQNNRIPASSINRARLLVDAEMTAGDPKIVVAIDCWESGPKLTDGGAQISSPTGTEGQGESTDKEPDLKGLIGAACGQANRFRRAISRNHRLPNPLRGRKSRIRGRGEIPAFEGAVESVGRQRPAPVFDRLERYRRQKSERSNACLEAKLEMQAAEPSQNLLRPLSPDWGTGDLNISANGLRRGRQKCNGRSPRTSVNVVLVPPGKPGT